jgi:hypothetical protein
MIVPSRRRRIDVFLFFVGFQERSEHEPSCSLHPMSFLAESGYAEGGDAELLVRKSGLNKLGPNLVFLVLGDF